MYNEFFQEQTFISFEVVPLNQNKLQKLQRIQAQTHLMQLKNQQYFFDKLKHCGEYEMAEAFHFFLFGASVYI